MGQATGQTRAGSDDLYEVAFGEAVRALSEQRAAIESVRGRAGLLLSAATVTTSFLGARALDGGALSAIAWLALASFIAMAAVLLAILWPPRWEFSADARNLIQTYMEAPEPAPIERLHRDLALHMHDSYAKNLNGLERLSALFQIASGLLITEVILWVVSIAS